MEDLGFIYEELYKKPEQIVEDAVKYLLLMANEMEANQFKGKREDWIKIDARTLVLDLCYHAAKLSAAIREDRPEKVKEFAADCGNMAMMAMLSYFNKKKIKPVAANKKLTELKKKTLELNIS